MAKYVKTHPSPSKPVAYGCGGASLGKHAAAFRPVVNDSTPLKGKKKGK